MYIQSITFFPSAPKPLMRPNGREDSGERRYGPRYEPFVVSLASHTNIVFCSEKKPSDYLFYIQQSNSSMWFTDYDHFIREVNDDPHGSLRRYYEEYEISKEEFIESVTDALKVIGII